VETRISTALAVLLLIVFAAVLSTAVACAGEKPSEGVQPAGVTEIPPPEPGNAVAPASVTEIRPESLLRAKRPPGG
jgi:hypothetical protein